VALTHPIPGRETRRRTAAVVAALATCLCAAGFVGAETKPIRFESLTPGHGLSQGTVLAIHQDSQGFMWFATEDGLNRYDGYAFTVFKHDPDDPGSLPNDFVFAIDEDAAGDLWVASEGGGVVRWERKTGRFARVTGLGSERVRALLIDGAGTVWIGTRDAGVDRLDPRTGEVRHYRQDASPGSLANDSVFALYEDGEGTVWVGTDGGLSRYDPASDSFTHHSHDPRDPRSLSESRVRSIAEGPGVLWIGTSERGVNRLERETGRVTRYRHDPDQPSSLSSDKVLALLRDDAGRLWIGSAAGLDLWRPETQGFGHYRHNPANPHGLSDDSIMSLYEDPGGVLWVGTRNGGVNKWNPATWSFGHHAVDPSDPQSLSDDNVMSFAEDAEGRLWIGTFGGGLNVVDRASGRYSHLRHDPQDPRSLSDDRVMALLRDRRGRLWVGTFRGGLNRLEPGAQRFTHYRHDPNDPASLGSSAIMSLFEDASGALWVGTYGGGLNRLDPGSGRVVRYQRDPSDPSSLSSDVVTSIVEDASGALWAGTDGGGLNVLDPETGVFRSFRHDAAERTSLSSDTIYALHLDESDNLWIGTRGGGLDMLDLGTWRQGSGEARFSNYSEREGLPNDSVYGIRPDSPGRLWLSTNAGLARFNPETGSVRSYNESHGLQGSEFHFGSHYASPRGELFFGGTGGFNAFFPDQLKSNMHQPPVVLTGFLKLNQPALLDTPVHLASSFVLGHEDDVVSFEFAALDYAAPERNRYAYKLEGFDADWVDADRIRRVTYTNLRPGDYVFRVRAANNDGVWNEAGLALPVRVLPPPWRTWWAHLAYVLLLAGAVYSFVRHHQRKVEREAENGHRLEAEVEKRTRELVENREALRLTQFAIDHAGVGAFWIDSNARLLYVNEAACRLLGYTREQLLAMSAQELDWAGGKDGCAGCWDELKRAGTLSFECEQRTQSGHMLPLEITANYIEFDGRELCCAFARDVSERKSLEEQVRQGQKMEAVGRLAGGVAHDFNNLLMAINGHAELLQRSAASEDEVRRHAEEIGKAGDQASNLTRQLLSFSRRQVLEARPLDLSAVVRNSLTMLERVLGEDIEIATRLEANQGQVRADEGELSQVVMNLAVNARDAMPQGGKLIIETADVELDEEYTRHHAGVAPGPSVMLAVSDTGCGMDAEVRSRAFEPFFTTKQKDKGTGLGLATVYAIAKRSGGHVQLYSEPGQGTTVKLYLPRVEEAPATAPEAPRTAPRGSESILLVEDEAVVRDVALEMLKSSGYEVLVAASPEEALQLSDEHDGAIDLLITDVVMPGMNGQKLAERLMEKRPGIAVLFMSGYTDDAVASHGLVEGRAHFLQKPFSGSILARKVREILD